MKVLTEYINIWADHAFWFQMFCVAVLAVMSLESISKKHRALLKAALEVLLLILIFFTTNFLIYLLSIKHIYFTGVGSWMSYLFGVVLFAAFFCKYPVPAKIVTASAVCSMSVIVIELGTSIGNVIEGYVNGFDSLWTKIIADFLILFAAWTIKKRPVSEYEVSTYAARLNVTCCTISTAFVIIYDFLAIYFLTPQKTDVTSVRILISLILIALYVINAINYLMTYSLCREQKHVLELMSEAQFTQSAAQLLTISDHNLNELRKISHNINNQYSYMRVLLQNQDYDGLKGYFDEVLGTFSKPFISYIDCGNRILNAIFNLEKAKADEAGVKMDFMILVPSELSVSELDLCNLITNIVDNAIENCLAERIESPVVSITMSVQGDYLFARFTNQTKKKKSFLEKPIVSTKKDHVYHGKGIGIAKHIVHKYNGHYSNKIEDGVFIAEFLLDLCIGKNKEGNS